MPDLQTSFELHVKEDEKAFTAISKSLEKLAESYEKIKDNHLAHIQESMGNMDSRMGKVESHIEWLKWGVILIVGGIVSLYFHK